MSYATIDDVTKTYKPILSSIGSLPDDISSIDVASVYISRAESVVNAYLSRRYVVPVSPVEPIVVHITADLSISFILMEQQPDVPDFFQARYDRAMKLLEGLRDGELDLSSGTITTEGDQEAWSSTEDYHPVFSPVLDPIDQAVDREQVDSDKDSRVDDL